MTTTHSDAADQEDIVITRTDIATERAYRVQLLIQRGRLKQLHAELRDLCPDDSVRPDAAKVVHLEAAAQLAGLESRLESVDEALARLREGQFGLCVGCAGAIPAERLEVRPDASLCVPCCEKLRRSG